MPGSNPGRATGSVAKTVQHSPLKREMREFDSPRTHQIERTGGGSLCALENGSRSKLIRMSIRLLTGGQLVRFQSGAPAVFCPRRLVVGRQAFNLRTRVQFSPRIPCVPLVQLDQDASLRNSRFRFESGAGYQSLGASSSGQDGALSLPRRGFDSPRARQKFEYIAGKLIR